MRFTHYSVIALTVIFMFTAIDNFSADKKETFASYIKGNRSGIRFTCPECGEPVIFYHGNSQAPHFRHRPMKKTSPSCARRSAEIRTDSCSCICEDAPLSGEGFTIKKLTDFRW